MNWPLVEVSKLIHTVHNGMPESGLPVYSVTKHHGFVPSAQYFSKQVFSKDTSRYKMCLPGDFAYATIHLDEGAIGITPEPCLISPMYTVFRPDHTRVYPQYFLRALKSDYALAQYSLIGNGSVERRKSIKIADLGRVRIPLPPLEEQKRIASFLTEVSNLRNGLSNELVKLDSLRNSLIDAFSKSASFRIPLKELADLQGGLSLSRKREVNPIEVAYLRVANVQRNRILLEDLKQIRCTVKEIERCKVQTGDILMLEANANPSEVGRSAVVEKADSNMVFQNHLFRVRPRNMPSNVLNALLSSQDVRAQLMKVAKTTSGLNTMTINQARNLQIPIGTLQEVAGFSHELNELDKLQRLTIKKVSLVGELENSITARAFSGKL